ncbi:MAG: cyclopropane-fatty-acyl-phospholipid synthase family protein [Bacteroidetes bacterium]|nr:cyclopropane-fatty-acyl-phospholipid synthase family protein [Bacteroidota bacterium]
MEKIGYIEAVSIKEKNYSFYKTVVISMLKKMTRGNLTLELPDGETHLFGTGNEIRARIKIIDNSFFRKCFLYGDIGFGESYVDGDWETDSITDVISWMILNIESNPSISGSEKKFSPISWLNSLNKIFHKFNNNSLLGSKRNISAHYDLDNEFFKLWLDKTMTYSSGIFEGKDISLEDAQIEKYDRICRELKINANDHILEIGSGWGGFSIYAATNYGCKITTTTISEEQYEFALNRITELGLDDKIEIVLRDYRQLTGQYDKIVSIEMLEAVGHKYLDTYFAKVNELLKSDGSVALQVITSHDTNYDELRKNVDWIQKHIFPGSLLPSVGAINKSINKTSNMHLHDLKNFGLDYAKTLKVWRNSFNEKIEDVKRLGFDEAFKRKWNYYLSYCEAAFAMRNIGVVQVIYTKPNNRKL